MNHSRVLLLAVVLTALAACQPKTTTPTVAADTSPPIAPVNGTPLSRAFWPVPKRKVPDAAVLTQ